MHAYITFFILTLIYFITVSSFYLSSDKSFFLVYYNIMSGRGRGRRPRSPPREGESAKDRKRRHDRERARERLQLQRIENPAASQEQLVRQSRQERER